MDVDVQGLLGECLGECVNDLLLAKSIRRTVHQKKQQQPALPKRIAYGIAGCCIGRQNLESVKGQIGCF